MVTKRMLISIYGGGKKGGYPWSFQNEVMDLANQTGKDSLETPDNSYKSTRVFKQVYVIWK